VLTPERKFRLLRFKGTSLRQWSPTNDVLPRSNKPHILTQHASVRVSGPNAKPVAFRKAGPQKSLMWKKGTISCLTRYPYPPRTSGTRSLHGEVSLFLTRALLMRLGSEANPLQNFRLPRVFTHAGWIPPKFLERFLLIPERKNSALGSEDGSRDEEPGQRTPLDLGTDIPRDRPLGETSVPSTLRGGLPNAPGTFDFLGAHLLGDPLEALASVLPDGLFEDIGKTTPFKFAQDIIESQIAVPFLCFLLIIVLFSFGHLSSLSSFQDSLRSVAAWSNFLEHTRANPDIETILRPKISQLEHTVVSQDEVIAGLTQELFDLKERYKVLETRARVPEAFPSRVLNLSSETGGEGVLPDAERMRLSAKSVSARQEAERLSRDLSSLRDEKLTLVAELNSAVIAKEALVIEKACLVAERDTALAERDTALAEKDRALSDKGRILAEKDEVSLALGKAVSERDLAEADKDQAVAERESALEKLKGIEGRY
jgi:hypothetical protein